MIFFLFGTSSWVATTVGGFLDVARVIETKRSGAKLIT